MNHLKNQDKFEQKLKEQFDNFEAKPNEALWDSIAQNLPTDNFEKTVAGKLNTLKFEPNESIWLAIEKRLPFIVQVNKKLIYLWTFVVLSFGVFAGFFINKMMNSSNTSGAMSHPKAFVWLEENKQLAISNKQAVILSLTKEAKSNEQLANSRPEFVEGSNIQNESVTEQKASSTMQKASNTLQTASSTEQKASSTMQKASSTLQIASSTEQKASSTMQKAPSTLQIAPKTSGSTNQNELGTGQKFNNSDLALNNKLPEIEKVAIKVVKPLQEPTKDSAIEATPLVKVDSIMASPKNKVVLAQQVSDENYTGASLKKEKLTIIAYGGLGYSYMRYAAGNDLKNSANNQKLREQTESTESEITGGFLVGYDLTKRFTISSGLILANFKQTMNFSKETAKNPGGNYEENMIYFNDTITAGNTNSTSLKYSFTEIPIFITYKALETQKFELAFQTGLGIGFVTGINTYIINTNNIGVYEVINKDDFPAFKNTLFFSFQPQFTYNLNSPGVSVGLMPIIKTSLTNIVNDGNWLKQYPYNMSMNLFLRKRF